MITLNESSDSQLKQELYTLTAYCQVVLDSGYDSVIAKKTIELIQTGKFEEYLDLEVNPDDYQDAEYFAADWQIVKMLSKSPNLPIDVDKRLEAELSFLDSEIACCEINKKLSRMSETEEPLWLWEMRRVIAQVLPPLTKNELEKVSNGFSHGPGSTTGVKGEGSCVVDKYDHNIYFTTNLSPYLEAAMGERWFSSAHDQLHVVEGGRFTTVPKKATTHRGIIIPPTANMYVQKGIGKAIRSKLRRAGLDLNFQQGINASFARRALTDSLSTLDLSAASDSIAMRVVEKVVPKDWFHLLCIAREPCVFFAGDFRPMHKFSAMGNGFTFELETLLFWALCKSVVPSHLHKDIAVYGDDIICPRSHVVDVIEALNYLGFSVNGSKSFLAGNFFESCGTDWFKGVDVRPFYLKGQSENIPYSVTIANRLRLHAKKRGFNSFCHNRYKSLWEAFKRVSPKNWQGCVVPEELGDVGLIGSEAECKRFKPTTGQLEGCYIKTMTGKPFKQAYFSTGVLYDKLTQIRPTALTYEGPFVSRDSVTEFCRSVDDLKDTSSIQRRDESKILEASMFAMYSIRGMNLRPVPRWTLINTWSSGLEWDLEPQSELSLIL